MSREKGAVGVSHPHFQDNICDCRAPEEGLFLFCFGFYFLFFKAISSCHVDVRRLFTAPERIGGGKQMQCFCAPFVDYQISLFTFGLGKSN